MFDIEYKGANAVVITTKKIAAFIDPKLSIVGLKDLSVNGIEVLTEARLGVNDEKALLSIQSPGEYEIADLSIRGISAMRHLDTPGKEPLSTIYRIEIGDVRIALLGNVAADLSEDQLEGLGVIDILILPIGGGGYTLDATSAVGLVRHIDPKVVIPVHYQDERLHYEVVQDTLDTFVKELGAPVEKTTKYKVKSSSVLPMALTVVEVVRS